MTIALMVFAKAAEAGVSKTRLKPLLGAAGAAAAYEELVQRTLAWVAPLAGGNSLYSVSLWGASEHSVLEAWSRQAGLPLWQQTDGDLGWRMQHALANALAQGASKAIVVGSDCPVMDANYIDLAQRALDEADVVFGQAEDGGYVLVGCKRALPELFEGIEWGGNRVLAQSLAKAKACGLSVVLLEALWDVDRPEDWLRYRRWVNGQADNG